MIRNMEKKQILRLDAQIPIKSGAVISQNLARRDSFELSLYSFGEGEGISEQVSFGDTFYYVIGGRAHFGLEGKEAAGEKGQAVLVPQGKPHSVEAESGLQLLYLQVFAHQQEGADGMYIKNFVQNEVVDICHQIDWEAGKIVSKTLVQREDMTLTLFAFDSGEGVSTHASAGDAMVVVLDGKAQITVDGVTREAEKGQTIVMPANIPHAVKAVTPYKMLLIVVKPER